MLAYQTFLTGNKTKLMSAQRSKIVVYSLDKVMWSIVKTKTLISVALNSG